MRARNSGLRATPDPELEREHYYSDNASHHSDTSDLSRSSSLAYSYSSANTDTHRINSLQLEIDLRNERIKELENAYEDLKRRTDFDNGALRTELEQMRAMLARSGKTDTPPPRQTGLADLETNKASSKLPVQQADEAKQQKINALEDKLRALEKAAAEKDAALAEAQKAAAEKDAALANSQKSLGAEKQALEKQLRALEKTAAEKGAALAEAQKAAAEKDAVLAEAQKALSNNGKKKKANCVAGGSRRGSNAEVANVDASTEPIVSQPASARREMWQILQDLRAETDQIARVAEAVTAHKMPSSESLEEAVSVPGDARSEPISEGCNCDASLTPQVAEDSVNTPPAPRMPSPERRSRHRRFCFPCTLM